MKTKSTGVTIHLVGTVIPNKHYWNSGQPHYLWCLPRGSRGYNMWAARMKFCPRERYVMVEKRNYKLTNHQIKILEVTYAESF